MNDDSKAAHRYTRFLNKVIQGEVVFIAESPNKVMILTSDEGEDGLAAWATADDLTAALSLSDTERGYEPRGIGLGEWLDETTPNLVSNRLEVAVWPIQGCTRAIFVCPTKLQEGLARLKEQYRSDSLALQESGLRRVRGEVRRRLKSKRPTTD